MTDAIRRPGELPLDFTFGARPKDEDAAARFRLADLRRSAGARGHAHAFAHRASAPRHLLWRQGVARIREV
jgi:hypothetical protein